MQTEILPTLKQHPKNSWANIESLLRAYRYFKECRNALMHQGGRATQACADAPLDFTQLTLAELYYKRAPLAPAVVVDEPLSIVLHDIVGLSNILHRLVVTMDAML